MSALSQSAMSSDLRWHQASRETPRVDRGKQALHVAINFVFGMPFLWALLIAVRGPLWWGSHRLFGDSVSRLPALLWVMVVALGALWIGVSLMFAARRGTKLAGVLMVFLGTLLLVAFHP